MADVHGTPWLVYPTPTWDDLVQLALDEIRAFGAGQYQVTRRMRALLDDLIAGLLPKNRRPALESQSHLLEDAVASISESQRAGALVPDRQGIGMARR